ncbi:MAG: PadR family transcriptional regulator [Lachnospiraceae bacterium]|nr:PadR family transcriptional regulator [Lachnospiraceae bacterium]
MRDTQLMKGILEGCILGIIAKGETYGYEILAQLDAVGFKDLGEGTLYPVLTRLNKKEYIFCRKAKSPLGPIRKYYTITVPGKAYLEDFKQNYQEITASADQVLFGGNHTPMRKETKRA